MILRVEKRSKNKNSISKGMKMSQLRQVNFIVYQDHFTKKQLYNAV